MTAFLGGAGGTLRMIRSNLHASLFSGSLVLEIIFAYPGVGRLMYEAVLQEDIKLIPAGMVVSDILLAVLAPCIRYSKE